MSRRLFHTADHVVNKVDDRYYLHLEGWDSATDETVSDAAKLVLARMNAIASMRYGNHRRATIKGVTRLDPTTGKLQTIVNLQGRAEIKSRNYGTLSVNGRSGGESAAEAEFKLADTNEPLERALYLYGTVEHDWVGLYKVSEAVEDCYGGEDKLLKKGLVSRPQDQGLQGDRLQLPSYWIGCTAW